MFDEVASRIQPCSINISCSIGGMCFWLLVRLSVTAEGSWLPESPSAGILPCCVRGRGEVARPPLGGVWQGPNTSWRFPHSELNTHVAVVCEFAYFLSPRGAFRLWYSVSAVVSQLFHLWHLHLFIYLIFFSTFVYRPSSKEHRMVYITSYLLLPSRQPSAVGEPERSQLASRGGIHRTRAGSDYA